MDPTAPKDNSKNTLTDPISPTPGEVPTPPNAWSPMEQPQSGGPQPNFTPDGAGPILPGQFVITGDGAPTQPQNAQTSSPLSASQNSVPLSASPQVPDTTQNTNPISPAINNLTAQDQLMTPPPNPQSPNSDPIPPPQSPATPTSQPDPTPFIPPVTPSSPGGFSKSPGGGIKKLRTVILILGIIILLMIIGAIAWIYFFGNKANQAAKTQNQPQSEPTIEQQPIPKRGNGGFDQIQGNSTPSGQLQESTPAGSVAPTP